MAEHTVHFLFQQCYSQLQVHILNQYTGIIHHIQHILKTAAYLLQIWDMVLVLLFEHCTKQHDAVMQLQSFSHVMEKRLSKHFGDVQLQAVITNSCYAVCRPRSVHHLWTGLFSALQ